MSLASFQTSHLCNAQNNLSSSEIASENFLTIEDLREQMCGTCGVLWTYNHVSLDCDECGGYGWYRPCPCDSNCKVLWKRDFTKSHSSGKDKWIGVCTNLIAQELCARLEKLSANQQT